MSWETVQKLRADIEAAEDVLASLKALLQDECAALYAAGDTTAEDGTKLIVRHKDGIKQNLSIDKIKARYPTAYKQIRESQLVTWEPIITKKHMEAYFSRAHNVKGKDVDPYMAQVCDEVKVPPVYGFRDPKGVDE